MQQQAAPSRFSDVHPNLNQEDVPIQYIPPELYNAIIYYNKLNISPNVYNKEDDEYLASILKDYKYSKALARAKLSHMPKLRFLKNKALKYPKLLMQINDPEIAALSSTQYSKDPDTYKLMNLIWNADFDKFDDIDCKDIKCTCDLLGEYDYAQLFGKHMNFDNETVILYRTCKRTIFAAAKRQMKSAPVPELLVKNDFIEFAKRKIEKCLGNRAQYDYLTNFGYSYNQWYNHLNSDKQKRMDMIKQKLEEFPEDFNEAMKNKEFWKLFHYEAICKKELQDTDGKPRMVCSIPDLVKYTMGPVCWKLEEIFTDNLPCYCGGMNLTEMQNKINHYIDEGFDMIAEGDGSAFDNTQDIGLKEIDRYIYRRIADKVYHVPKELFLYCSQQYYKIMDVITVDPIQRKRKTLFTYAVLGTVFSGDCDTTLMNTTRMGLYNWYTNYKYGLKFFQHYICFSKGDDFTVMYSNTVNKESIRLAYKKYWLAKAKPKDSTKEFDNRQFGLGQILKFIEVGQPHDIKFCSLRAWYLRPESNHIFLTRNPEKFYNLAMYSRKIRNKNKTQSIQYLIDQAVALKVSYGGIEFFETIIQKYLEAAYAIDNEIYFKRAAVARDRRHTLLLEVQDLGKFDPYYDYTPRKEFYKIKTDEAYWESRKRIERCQQYQPTPEELKYINEQINEEFCPDSYRIEF